MELIVEPDIYSPSLDENGNYIDKIPSNIILKKGLRCPCGARKDKIYDCSAYFSNHIKTITHKKWLTDMNANKLNYYTDNVQLKETIANQKIIIARLEKEINIKTKTIDYLTQQLVYKDTHSSQSSTADLLDFD
jgi:hypothetical protein